MSVLPPCDKETASLGCITISLSSPPMASFDFMSLVSAKVPSKVEAAKPPRDNLTRTNGSGAPIICVRTKSFAFTIDNVKSPPCASRA